MIGGDQVRTGHKAATSQSDAVGGHVHNCKYIKSLTYIILINFRNTCLPWWIHLKLKADLCFYLDSKTGIMLCFNLKLHQIDSFVF